jgi:hypothetical protein
MSFDPVQAHFALADRLKADSYFADLTIVTEQPRDPANVLGNAMEQAMAVVTGKGAAVFVGLPDFTQAGGPERALFWDRVEFIGLAMTSDLLNATAPGTGLRCSAIADRIAANWHGFDMPGLLSGLTVEAKQMERWTGVPEEVAKLIRDMGLTTWAIKAVGQMQLDATAKVATPTLTANVDGKIVLACTTSGAAIWYTTDGTTYPCAANAPTAALYSAPFTPAAACLVSAGAQKTGLIPSDVASANWSL